MVQRVLAALTLGAAAAAPLFIPDEVTPVAGCTVEHATDPDRLAWWRDARFGMFIHWGVYAVPAGVWGDRTNYGEWIRQEARIPVGEYEKLAARFNPRKFDARAIARAARAAGMRYIVITTKHHDGFCLFSTATTDWSVMHTPFKRDIMKEMAEACRDEGLKIGWYYSIMDWHHPDYLPRRDWEKDRSTDGADLDRYVASMKAQLRELLTNYGEVGVLWFDGQWENTWTEERGRDLEQYVRSLQPGIIINSRVGPGGGMDHGLAGRTLGDYATPEQFIPDTPPEGDWETCMTMNDHWGYCAADRNYKPAADLIRKLADIASKGGNFLLNIGPTADGEIPPESVHRLAQIGAWMDVSAASISATRPGPFPPKLLPWGVCTTAAAPPPGGPAATRLYLHVLDLPAGGTLHVPALYSPVRGAAWLADPARSLATVSTEDGVTITLTDPPAPSPDSVVVLDVLGTPDIGLPPTFAAEEAIFTDTLDVLLSTTREGVAIRYTLDGTAPTAASPVADGPVTLRETATVAAACFRLADAAGGRPARVSPIARQTYTRVTPAAGRKPGLGKPGLRFSVFELAEDLATLDDLAGVPSAQAVCEGFDLSMRPRKERFAVRFEGDLLVPVPGLYRLHLGSDDGSRLYLNGTLLIDNDRPHVFGEKSASVALGPGLHSIRADYFQNRGGADLKVQWSGPGFDKRPIAPDDLSHGP